MAKQLTTRQRVALWAWDAGAGGVRSDLRQVVLQTESKAGIDADNPSQLLDITRTGAQRPMQPGRCANFDGVDDYVSLGSPAALQFSSGSFSLSCWANPDVSNGGVTTFASCGASGWIWQASQFWYRGAWRSYGSNLVTAAQWRHYVIVFDDDADTLTLYRDGVVVATMTAVTGSYGTGGEVLLGKYGGNLLDGKQFDFRAYSRALNASEVSQIYATAKPGGRPDVALYPSNLVGHWKLDAGINPASGFGPGIMFDSSGNGYHGAAVNHSTTFYYEGADVPFSWQNEVGYTTAAASTYPTWTNLIPNFSASTWTAAGTDGKATALTNQAWAGRTGLRAAKFLNGAIGTYTDNRVVTGQLGITVPANKGVVCEMDIALSRPLVAGEKIKVYFVGAVTGSPIDLESFSGVGTTFKRLVGSIVSRTPSYTDTLFAIAPVAGVTGGDITVYIDNVKYYDTGIDVVDGTALDGQRWSEVIPQNSAVPSRDILGNVLQFTGQCPRNAKLIDSYCGTFDGVDDKAVSASPVTSGATVALTAGVRIKTSMVPSGVIYVLGEWSETDNNRKWLLSLQVGGKIRFYCSVDGSNGGTSTRSVETLQPVNDGLWHHVAVSFAPNDLKIYIDGVEAATTVTASNTCNALFNAGASAVVSIGRSLANGGPYAGQLCDAKVYGAVLSANDIALWAAGKDITATPLAHYPIAEGDGTTLYDCSGNGKHATLTGATLATFWGTRQSVFHRNIRRGFRMANATGNGRTLDGTSQYFERAYSNAWDVADSPMFVAAVVKASGADNGDRGLFGLQKTNQHTWRIYYHGGVKQYALSCIETGTSSNRIAYTTGTVWLTDQYALIFGYHDPVANTIGVSFNGSAFTTTALNGGLRVLSNDIQVGLGEGVGYYSGEIAMLAFAKPASVPASWAAIRDAIYNGGVPLTYDQLSAQQKADWGIVSWYDCDEFTNRLLDKHGANHLTGYGMPLVPAIINGGAADGGSVNAQAGVWHNACETKVDFRGGVAASPWCDAARVGYAIPQTYQFGDALPSANMTKRAVTVPSGRESHFMIK